MRLIPFKSFFWKGLRGNPNPDPFGFGAIFRAESTCTSDETSFSHVFSCFLMFYLSFAVSCDSLGFLWCGKKSPTRLLWSQMVQPKSKQNESLLSASNFEWFRFRSSFIESAHLCCADTWVRLSLWNIVVVFETPVPLDLFIIKLRAIVFAFSTVFASTALVSVGYIVFGFCSSFFHFSFENNDEQWKQFGPSEPNTVRCYIFGLPFT